MLSQLQNKRLQVKILAGTLILEFVKSCYVPVQAIQPTAMSSSDVQLLDNNLDQSVSSTNGLGAVSGFGSTCSTGRSTSSLTLDSTQASDVQILAQLPQPLQEGATCPAQFTNIPCGEGEDLLCEVGGPQPDAIGGAELLPLLASSGSGIGGPLAAGLGALGAIGATAGALSSGGGGGGGGGASSTPEPIPEPSTVPASVLVLGLLYWVRKKRSTSN
jgi:hypothetical protein